MLYSLWGIWVIFILSLICTQKDVSGDDSDSEENFIVFATPKSPECEMPYEHWIIRKQYGKLCIRFGQIVWEKCDAKDLYMFGDKRLSDLKMLKCNETDLYCEEEIFKHHYQSNTGKIEYFENKWNKAKAGQKVGLKRVCLKSNGLPVVRKCLYNKHLRKSEWEDISKWPKITCIFQAKEPIISSKLNDLFVGIQNGTLSMKTSVERKNTLASVRSMLNEKNKKIIPNDIFLISQIVKSATEEGADVELSTEVMDICNDLISVDKKTLHISSELNSTNEFVATFESYIDFMAAKLENQLSCSTSLEKKTVLDVHTKFETIELNQKGVRGYISDQLLIFLVNPKCSNITGIAFYRDTGKTLNKSIIKSRKRTILYRFIYVNEDIDDLILEENELELAGYFPSSLWLHLKSKNELKMFTFKIYTHDSLFVDRSLIQNKKPTSQIFSASLIGYKGNLPENFIFVLRNQGFIDTDLRNARNFSGCAYWNYSTWVNDGVETLSNESYNKTLVKCGTKHFTPFSYLLGGSYKQNDFSDSVIITPFHATILDYISLVGCGLSLIGLLGIVLTAVLFPKWRKMPSTKILLNLCAALALQMILFVFINTDTRSEELIQEGNYTNCIVLGALMQYSILVLFCWMLISALLQFQRYVTVIGGYKPDHYILKAAAIAWLAPLLPTLLLCFIEPDSYIPTIYQLQTDTGICYPTGSGLHYGIILPIILILITNTIVFVHVIWSATTTLQQSSQRRERKMVFQQIRLYILLVFLLGLTWIFGVLAFMKAGIAFSYLFCVTATTQGFVFFVYFVVLNKTSQECWQNLCKTSDKYDVNPEGIFLTKICQFCCKCCRRENKSDIPTGRPSKSYKDQMVEELTSETIDDHK